MTVAEFCIFGVVAIYLLTIVPVIWFSSRKYDNSKPRDPAFYDDAIGAFALGAHHNGPGGILLLRIGRAFGRTSRSPRRRIDELAVWFWGRPHRRRLQDISKPPDAYKQVTRSAAM